MEATMTALPSTIKELPARSSPRPEDLVAAFYALASERGPEFAGVAMFAYLTKNLAAIDDVDHKDKRA
jgi:hypothetical protein